MSEDLALALQTWAVTVPCWLVFWLIWSGRALRSWLDDNLFGPFAVTFLPGFALTLTMFGASLLLNARWLFILGFVPFFGGIVLQFVVALKDPPSLQPRWRRELQSNGDPGQGRR